MGTLRRWAAPAAVLVVTVAAFLGRVSAQEIKWIPIEDLLSGNKPLTNGVQTRGILEVSPRQPGGGYRGYYLTPSFDSKVATVQRRLPIQPVGVAQGTFAFDADTLNMREIEVVGSFQAPNGMSAPGSSEVLWFWSYAQPHDDDAEKVQNHKPGEISIDGIADRPPTLDKKTLVVVGQFRGKNLFKDLEGEAPQDGWVLKDGAHAVWIVGKKPRGAGFSLDPESKSDTAKWLEVTGKVERRGDLVMIRASQIALIPKPAAAESE
jgi:hypothetical protein